MQLEEKGGRERERRKGGRRQTNDGQSGWGGIRQFTKDSSFLSGGMMTRCRNGRNLW